MCCSPLQNPYSVLPTTPTHCCDWEVFVFLANLMKQFVATCERKSRSVIGLNVIGTYFIKTRACGYHLLFIVCSSLVSNFCKNLWTCGAQWIVDGVPEKLPSGDYPISKTCQPIDMRS